MLKAGAKVYILKFGVKAQRSGTIRQLRGGLLNRKFGFNLKGYISNWGMENHENTGTDQGCELMEHLNRRTRAKLGHGGGADG